MMSQSIDRFVSMPQGERLAITEPFFPHAKTTAVILHGFQSSRRGANAIAAMHAAVAAGLNAVTVDFYAHGESDGDFQNLTIAKSIDTVQQITADIYRRDPQQRIILIGASFGGLIALHAFAVFSNHVTGLILRAPVSDWWDLWRHRVTADEIKNWEKCGFHRAKNVSGFDVTYGREFLDDIRKNDVYSDIAPRITCPTLIVHGDADDTVPLAQSEKLQSVLPNGELIVLAGADHGFSRKEDLQAYQTHIKDFLHRHDV